MNFMLTTRCNRAAAGDYLSHYQIVNVKLRDDYNKLFTILPKFL